MIRIRKFATVLVFLSLFVCGNETAYSKYDKTLTKQEIVKEFCDALIKGNYFLADSLAFETVTMEKIRNMNLKTFKIQNESLSNATSVTVEMTFVNQKKNGVYTIHFRNGKVGAIVASISVPKIRINPSSHPGGN